MMRWFFRPRHLTKFLGTAFVTVFATTCDLPPTFGPEYYNEETNYIAASALAVPPLATDTGSTISLNSSGIWDWSWRGITGNTYQYMTMAEAGTVGSAVTQDAYALAADAAVWRLELVNLFINGNFEQALTSGSFIASPAAAVNITTTGAINGQSLYMDFNDGNEYVQWKMITLLDDLVTFPDTAGPSYALRFLVNPNTDLSYFTIQATELDTVDDGTPFEVTPDAGSIFIPQRISGFNDDYRFVIRNSNAETRVDDARAIRANVDPFIRLLLRPADTSPSLVAGQYEFAIWARMDDADRTFDDPDRVAEDYASPNLTLRIRQVDGADITSTLTIAYSATTTREWQRFSVRMANPSNMDRFDESSTTPVLELSVSPTNIDRADAGAILVAAPELTFHINGF